MSIDTGWTTRNEIKYINGLISGMFREKSRYGRSRRLPVEGLLKNYINSAKKRERWGTFGSVDPKKVIAYAQEQLEKRQ